MHKFAFYTAVTGIIFMTGQPSLQMGLTIRRLILVPFATIHIFEHVTYFNQLVSGIFQLDAVISVKVMALVKVNVLCLVHLG